MGPDGMLQDIYDFKFEGDSFDNNPGQKELYEEALHGQRNAEDMIIDQKLCSCK